jgi:hypothetical protein
MHKNLKKSVLVQTTKFVQPQPDKFVAKCAVIIYLYDKATNAHS